MEDATHNMVSVVHIFKEALRNCSQMKIRSPEHCLKQDRWQGPPLIKVRQYETVLPFLKWQFVYSVMEAKRDSLFSLLRCKRYFSHD